MGSYNIFKSKVISTERLLKSSLPHLVIEPTNCEKKIILYFYNADQKGQL